MPIFFNSGLGVGLYAALDDAKKFHIEMNSKEFFNHSALVLNCAFHPRPTAFHTNIKSNELHVIQLLPAIFDTSTFLIQSIP